MDINALFSPRLPEESIEIDGVGTVRVRGLNRLEATHVQAANGAEAVDRRVLALGMVDPAMTEGEVYKWQQAATAGEIERITAAIARLSGMAPDADKEAYKSIPGGSSD